MNQIINNTVPGGDYTDFVTVTVQPDPAAPPIQETIRYDTFVQWLFKLDSEPMMALHCALGVSGEVAELIEADSISTPTHVIEEAGDLEFYLQATRNHYSISRDAIIATDNDFEEEYNSFEGLVVGAGRLADAIKREYIYRKPRERVEIIAALNMIEYYIDSYHPEGRSHTLQENANKLSIRYATLRYSDKAAIERADKNLGTSV